MIEEKFSIPASDGKSIYYLLNKAETSDANGLVIIGHGLTGHIHEFLHQQAKFYFTQEHNYDVARISFYGGEKDARKLDECVVQTHADDVNAMVAAMKGRYQSIFYIGHSYGGLTALLANPDVDGTVFWDSTYTPDFWDHEAVYVPKLDCYQLDWGVKMLVSKAMVEEAAALTYDVMRAKAAAFQSPALVVLAGDNTEKIEGRERLYDDLPNPKALVSIDDAGHCFVEGSTVSDLLRETANWIRQQ